MLVCFHKQEKNFNEKHYRQIKTMLPKKMIASVPAELQEEFDNIQLNNSIQRIRLLTVIALVVKLISAIFVFITNEPQQIGGLFDLFDYGELIIIALFNVAVVIFAKFNKKRMLWFVCYLVIAGFFILYEFTINYTETINQIPFIFFITIFMLTVLPDFKPRVFIMFALLYFVVTVCILVFKNQAVFEYYGMQSHIFYIFLFILVTKILLYNSKVRTFVNTYNINKLNENLISANTEIKNQKEELRKYNNNLEKMVVEKANRIVTLKNVVMETMAELVEHRDDVTGGHITRTSKDLRIVINTMLAKGLYREQVSSWDIEQVVLSAQLHDVGKVAIDDSILRKPGKLTPDEFEIMKQHTVFGGEIIRKIQEKTGEQEFLDFAFIFAVYHHEKWDGTGYPYGKAGLDIPLPARLMAIIDVYDALISERPYKKPFTHEEAIKIINEGKGIQFDPALTELFLSISDQLR